MTDWKDRALAAEKELAQIKGKPQFDSLKDEIIAHFGDGDDYSENGTQGDAEISSSLKEYFKDKPERGYAKVGHDEVFNGRNAWPPFTEVFVFEVDGQLYAIDGESDSWEGGWPIYDYNTIRPVEKTTKTVEVTEYKEV